MEVALLGILFAIYCAARNGFDVAFVDAEVQTRVDGGGLKLSNGAVVQRAFRSAFAKVFKKRVHFRVSISRKLLFPGLDSPKRRAHNSEFLHCSIAISAKQAQGKQKSEPESARFC